MKAHGGSLPAGKLSEALAKAFHSLEEFKKQFSDAGKTRFGSGWAWLCLDDTGSLFICSTPNQDNPKSGGEFLIRISIFWKNH